MLLALKTMEELERFHYITNSPVHHVYADALQLDHQIYNLENEVESLQEQVDELEQELWQLQND